MSELANFRKKLNLTQDEIAKKLEVSTSYYSKIEIGNKQPSYNFIVSFLAHYPDVDLRIFFAYQVHL